MTRMHISVFLSFIFVIHVRLLDAQDYFGVKLGNLRNSSYGLSGEAWLVNETTIQIINFKISPNSDNLKVGLFFSTKSDVVRATQLYQVIDSPNGAYSKPISDDLDRGVDGKRIVVRIPKNTHKQWSFFGVVAEKTWTYLAASKLDKSPPASFCCINNPKTPNKGIVGRHYGAGSGPILIQDARTIILPNFELEGTKPPDAWIYAGVGEINQENGQKAFIVGRDTPQNHCSIHEDYNGDSDMVVVLADGQTVYNINFISVFCYQYNVNFGNVRLHLDPNTTPVPPYIPPVRDSPFPSTSSQC